MYSEAESFAAAWNSAQLVPWEEPEPEQRIDPEDGEAKTEEQFLEQYGEDGHARWDAATKIAKKPMLGGGPPSNYGDPMKALKKLRR